MPYVCVLFLYKKRPLENIILFTHNFFEVLCTRFHLVRFPRLSKKFPCSDYRSIYNLFSERLFQMWYSIIYNFIFICCFFSSFSIFLITSPPQMPLPCLENYSPKFENFENLHKIQNLNVENSKQS